MKFSIFAASAAIVASVSAAPVARDGQTVPDLVEKLGLTQDQEAAVPQLLKNLGLAPTKRDGEAVPDLLEKLGLTQDQEAAVP
ncbi:hypothetical protein E3Q22_03737, partial [Wallemia mellicola]